uniref:SMC_N domain-containing protein n=1 Tax=Macrostomum lignano TaxID=282301 RepID=A0A1I8GF27_9PLAT
VIIQGFRSYRDQISPEEFSSRHNIIGHHLSNTERQNLLHEGTGPRVISAYVEIIFDNTDNRIPIEKPEVSLRRIIGNKKDQYFLDKKMVTKADVVNLFESAGFSRSNPYYIVKQGKITQLATSPDSQRLKLLREVAGTRVYDERKEESKLILKESEGRMEKIQEFLNQIEERLRNLESETKELKEYQRWDRDRRALEYTIHDRELKETTKKLEELQRKRETSSGSATKVRAMAKECADEVERLDNDLRAQLTGDTSQRSRAQEELRQVRKSCEDAELKLQQLRPQYEEARRKEEGAANQLSDAEHRRKELYAKQGRGNQFQISSNSKLFQEEIDNDAKRVTELEATIASCEKELVELKGDLDHGGEDVRLLRRRKEELHAERQAVYREELGLQQQLNSLREELSRCDQSLRARTGKGILSGIDSVRQVNSKINELEKRETARSKYEMNYDRRKTLLNRAREELRNVKEGQPNKEWKLGSLKHELEQMKSTRESYQAELGSDLLSQLSVEEQREVDSLNDRIQELTREAKQLYNARIRLENEKTTIENQLHHNLLRRREQLETQLDEVAAETVKERLTEAEEELAEIENRVAAFQREMQSEEDRIARFGQSIDDLHQRIEAKKAEEKEHLDKISDDQTSLEKMQTKQSQLLAKKEECMKKIRELGSLPADAFDKFQDKSSKQLFKSLERANREIKNYAHVNKKALDQFLSSSEEKEKLLKGKEELDEALKSIQDLMVTLEHRKYEAIQFTFKQVSKYFKEIFSKLVPEGVAELVMQKGDAPAADDSGEPVDQVTSEMQRFVGIGIRVSFTGKTADMKDMNQLSGGQKSLVALTLIFAIQKCDPAPFYLFDEIDAALDAAHRRSVSAMIKELSQEAQFISTTFRPELLDSADKFYGVKFRNK